MRSLLIGLFGAIFVVMISVTLWATFQANLLDPAVRSAFNAQPWAIATLFDAYCGFITFYVWVAYRERSMGVRILWLLLILLLGNIAMSLYALQQLLRLRPGEPLSALLSRRGLETPQEA